MKLQIFTVVCFLLCATAASAQVPGLEALIPQGDGAVSGRIIQLVALLTVLSVAPGLLIMVTSFTRFVDRALVPALRPRPADARPPTGPDQPVAVHDVLRDGADLRPRLAGRHPAAASRTRSPKRRRSRRITEPFREFMLASTRARTCSSSVDIAPASEPARRSSPRREGRPARRRSRPSWSRSSAAPSRSAS